jgi:flagellar hook capping protein FlgD
MLSLLAVVGCTSLITGPPAHAQYRTSSMTLTWTATGDNGLVGQAAKYDLRYSATVISGNDTLSWWNAAAVFPMGGRVPPPAGTRDSVAVPGLIIGLKYYAILRLADAAGNWSGFSNVAVMDLTHGVTDVAVEVAVPKLVVGAPYPSPTRGQAQISMTLARSGPLQAAVYDAQGRLVRSLHSGTMDAGPHTLRWDGHAESGAHASAGVYWIRVAADDMKKTVKLVVVR